MKRTLAALVLATLCACTPHPSGERAAPATPSPAPRNSELPPITVRSKGSAQQPVRIFEQQGNRKFYELIARTTESTIQSGNRFRGTFSDTTVTFYGSDGTRLGARAPEATIDKGKETVTMTGGVRARTSEGITLQCDVLEYDRASGKVHGTGNVHLTSPQGYTMTGGSITSDLKLTQVHME